MQPPEIPTFVIDDKFKRELSERLPSMNEPQILDLWFEVIPDARRDQPGEQSDARLYVTGMLVTELRRRAHMQHSIERLHRCQVLANDMKQIVDHFKFKAIQNDPKTRAAARGLWTPGMGDE